ncbi:MULTISPECIES: isochorismate synthase [Microcoleus]|nr:isochorismate synthase [Microcoleus sp. FACHB-84]MBD2011927.1 isochorismate synthase [Microcoleus sp. FACHB-45]
MNLSKSLTNAMRYVSEAAVRIFSPSDDNYPNSGVQPFEGKLSKTSKSRD